MTGKDIFKKYTDDATYAKIVDYASVSEMWENSVSLYGENIAVIDGEKKVSYKELDGQVGAMRAHLLEKGVKRGDRVGILIPNSLEFARAYLAVTTLGAVAVLLPAHLDNMTVFGCSMKFSLTSLIYAEALRDKTDILAAKNPRVSLIPEGAAAEGYAPAVLCDKKEPCCILFTGGTTGKSKGALLSNGATMRGTKNGCFGTREVFEQRYLLVLPLTHVFGLIRNMLTSMYTGSTLFICKNNKDMFRDIATFRPTVLVLVPALVELALNLSKQFSRNMFGDSLHYIICGASAVSPYLVEECHKIGVTLLPGYGLTESANLVSGNPEALAKPASVGLIYEGMEYRIVDGELWLKGENMMEHYVAEDEENALSYEDGWFKTGDLVRIDEDGFLYVTGRKKELIVLPGGENVSPQEVEARFNEYEEIQDCLLYDDERGRLIIEVLPRAAIIKARGIGDVLAHMKGIVNKVNETLPAFSRVNEVIVRSEDFLRSPSMKIVRGQNKK